MHACIHAYIHTYNIHAYILTYIHTYKHIYIHTCVFLPCYCHVFIFRLDRDLKSEEEAHHIKCRWPQSSSQYKEVHSSLSKRREKELGEIMWSTSSRRQFLLKLKAKHNIHTHILFLKVSPTHSLKKYLPANEFTCVLYTVM